MTSVGQALNDAARRLARAGVAEARRDAALLLAEVLGTDRGGVLARRGEPLPPEQAARYAVWIERRASREPLQHITGTQEFYGLTLEVDRRVLVPRPETEGLVEAVLNRDLPERARVADLGTGSGCIAIALAVERRDLELFALDASADALELARRNARRHGVEERIEFRHARLERPPREWNGRMDAVLSNPPYVSAGEWESLEPEVRDHDPREALLAGPSGLEAHRALAPAAFDLLRPDGLLVLEVGWGQADAVGELVGAAGFRAIEQLADLQGIPRVLVAERP
jgi:release factor glutamine methyltransferase